MKRISVLLTILVPSFIVCVQGQATNRNVHNYEAGAVYDERSQLSNPNANVRGSAKNYLLAAWRNKKQVYFRVVRYSREGARTSCMYFVEESGKGKWQVATQCTVNECPSRPGRICRQTFENVYDVVDDVTGAEKENIPAFFGPPLLVLTNSTTGQKHHF